MSLSPCSELHMLRLIIREQQRQHERLIKVVRAWAEAGTLPPSNAATTPTPRRDVSKYLSAASSFGCTDGKSHSATRMPLARLRSSGSTSPRKCPSPAPQLNPMIICTNNVQKPLLAQTQDLRPNRSRPAPMCNSLLSQPMTRTRPTAFPRLGSNPSKNPPKARTVHFADVVRTRLSVYEGENEVTEDLAERFHAPFFIKLLFFILIFDLDMTLISVLAIAFALYIQGVFEPLLRFFRPEHPRRVNVVQQRPGAAPAGVEALNNNNQLPPPRERVAAPPPAQVGVAAAAAETPPAEAPSSSAEAATDGAGAAAEVVDVRAHHGRWVRVLYQSLGMFLGTLLPWWQPDERYIV